MRLRKITVQRLTFTVVDFGEDDRSIMYKKYKLHRVSKKVANHTLRLCTVDRL